MAETVGITKAIVNLNDIQDKFHLTQTKGEDYLFIKLDHQTHQYGLSDKFTIAKHNNREFYEVLQIIKRIINGTVQE